MAGIDLLTTRTTEWSRNMPPSPQWTDRADVFYMEFKEDEELPLDLLDYTAHVSLGGVLEKRQCKTDKRMVAVKKVATHQNETSNTELRKEVEILRSLKHYHVVKILGCYTQGDFFSIVMEPFAMCDLDTYLSYPSSSSAVKIESKCGPRNSFLPTIMGCLAHGLQYIHKEPRARHISDEEKMVRHRDITPKNILLDGTRVLYADFGLSKFFTATQTGSSGTGSSRRTRMYTSPERETKKHRSTPCDIFSLACVFAEIFNVYKKKTKEEFLVHRIKADPEGEGYFHKANVILAVFEWLDELATERCDVQIIRLLREMLDFDPDRRPNAEQVWKVLTTITNNTSPLSTIYFCGPCCMPLLHKDPLLKIDPGVDPSQTKYASSVPLHNPTPVSKDLYFGKTYAGDEQLDVSWKRNLRHWNRSILDVVQGESHPLLARKRIISSGNDEGSSLAKNEAEILRKAEHRHIVTLHSTYRQGDVFTLLYKPAADHDLRSYLELAEVCTNQRGKVPVDLDFMTRSFGCLANALACVHAAGYDHGDIRPENILVHDHRIYLSKFSFGLKLEFGAQDSRPSNQQPYRFLNFGRLSLGRPGEDQTSAGTERQQRQQPGPYQPPEWQPTSVGQPAADVFALGCVFLEIYTVLCGKRVRDFGEFRAEKNGDLAYHRTLPRALAWLLKLVNETHEHREKFQKVIRSMIETDASKRPRAVDVARSMRECKTSKGLIFSGDCHDHI